MPTIKHDYKELQENVSEEIQNLTAVIYSELKRCERHSVFQEIRSCESIVELRILVDLRNRLADIRQYIGDRNHEMLDAEDYLRWACENNPEEAESITQEIEELAY